jgi:hypothetical protein
VPAAARRETALLSRETAYDTRVAVKGQFVCQGRRRLVAGGGALAQSLRG